ncbi:hypothetical protein CI610_03592 [invertebrate metagenome]|uniref:Reverse transcriptase domain-containing protein n=1 Tax=invertebrate metagenome TaxID=1711999 RepID=A0A2H9T2N3_9ZZZZ
MQFLSAHRLGFNGKFWRILKHSFENVTSCVLYEGKTSGSYPVKQGVGQGRTLSAWLFLVMINDLANALDDAEQGLHIQKLHIPCVFLADDTLLLTGSIAKLQAQLDIVFEYAKEWRLNYNSAKSSVMEFSYKRRFANSKTAVCSLGDAIIQWADTKTYAGITFCPNLKADVGIESACSKGRRSLNSLMSVGVHPGGLNPLISAKLIKTIILPGVIYGCELWANVTQKSADMLNRTMRYAARRCQGFEETSPSAITTRAIGLPDDLWSEVEIRKLYLWNKLCNAKSSFVWKSLFIIRLCSFMFTAQTFQNVSFVVDILQTMVKYQIESFFFEYILSGTCCREFQWKSFVKKVVTNYHFDAWCQTCESRPDLLYYRAVHQDIGPNPLWLLTLKFPKMTWKICELIKLSYRVDLKNVMCKLCNKAVNNDVKHFLLQCPALFQSRDMLLEQIVNCISVDKYVQYDMIGEDEKCSFILGGRHDIILGDEEWDNLIVAISDKLTEMFSEMTKLLQKSS